MPRKLIAFTANAGAGKSVAADHLIDLGFTRVKLAQVLKDMIRVIYRHAGLDEESIERKIEGDLKEVPCDILEGRTPRWAMQTLGGEWGRDMIGLNFWINLWKRRVGNLGPGALVTVDDCRYVNEVAAVHELGGQVIRVIRSANTKDVGDHPSERFEFDADLTIFNDSDIDTFRARVDQAIGRVEHDDDHLRSAVAALGDRLATL